MGCIENKRLLREYLKEDAKHYKYPRANFFIRLLLRFASNPLSDECIVWRYVRCLRYSEYHLNRTCNDGMLNFNSFKHSPYHFFMTLYYYHKLNKLSYKTGFQIPPNVCGPGLNIYHFGYIVINASTQIGKNVTLYPGVLIGWKNVGDKCPVIGDNVFIGSGSKIIGNVHIGNSVKIGQDCVIVKDVPDGTTVVAPKGRMI